MSYRCGCSPEEKALEVQVNDNTKELADQKKEDERLNSELLKVEEKADANETTNAQQQIEIDETKADLQEVKSQPQGAAILKVSHDSLEQARGFAMTDGEWYKVNYKVNPDAPDKDFVTNPDELNYNEDNDTFTTKAGVLKAKVEVEFDMSGFGSVEGVAEVEIRRFSDQEVVARDEDSFEGDSPDTFVELNAVGNLEQDEEVEVYVRVLGTDAVFDNSDVVMEKVFTAEVRDDQVKLNTPEDSSLSGEGLNVEDALKEFVTAFDGFSFLSELLNPIGTIVARKDNLANGGFSYGTWEKIDMPDGYGLVSSQSGGKAQTEGEVKSHTHTMASGGKHTHTMGSSGSHTHNSGIRTSNTVGYAVYGLGSVSSGTRQSTNTGTGSSSPLTSTTGSHTHTINDTNSEHTHTIENTGGNANKSAGIEVVFYERVA